MKSKKSQAAMELISTYGWAILTVLVAIFALMYYITFYPGDLPQVCVFETGFFCYDVGFNDNNITISIRNKMGAIDFNGEVGFKDKCQNINGVYIDNDNGWPLKIKDDRVFDLIIGCGDLEKGRFSDDIVINYTSSETGLKHTMKGSIRGNVK